MGVPRADVDALARTGTPAATGWLVDPDRALVLANELAAAVAAHDAADPLDPGLPIEAARRAVGLPEPRLVEALLRHAVARGTDPGLVLRDGRVVRSAAGSLPAAVRDGMDALRADLERDPFAAPEAARLVELGLGPRQLGSLVKAGELLRVAEGIVLLPGADRRALEVLAGLGPEFTLSEARQALGTTRRVAVPLLELLARTGRTARTPDGGHRLA
jgi:selenocysteine-specific elongation factor